MKHTYYDESKEKELFKFEYEYFDGYDFITLNMLDIDFIRSKITIEVTNRGRLYPVSFQLFTDNNGCYFFYGNYPYVEKIYATDFIYKEA